MYNDISIDHGSVFKLLYLRFTQLHQKLSFPLLILLALFQRTPVLRVILGQNSNLLSISPGQVLRSVIAIAATMGPIVTNAGATTFDLTPAGSPAGTFKVTLGTPISPVSFTTTAESDVESYTIVGSLPPGLSFSPGVSGGIINLDAPGGSATITGTPTTAGTYTFTAQAWGSPSGSGKTDKVLNLVTFIVTGSAATAPSITTQPVAQVVTAGANATFTVAASGTAPLTYQWKFNGTAISGATTSSYTVTNAQSANAGNYSVDVTNSVNTATSNSVALTVNAALAIPSFTLQPLGAKVLSGQLIVLSALAQSTVSISYQWYKDSVAISGATGTSLTIASAAAADVGSYTVKATNSAGTATSNPALIALSTDTTAPIVNVSVLTTPGNGEPAIMGFVVPGPNSQSVLIRAAGPAVLSIDPTLTVMADPGLVLWDKGTPTTPSKIVAQNDNWDASLAPFFTRVGAFAYQNGSKDAAILITLAPGIYTAHVNPASGGTGRVLCEVYLIQPTAAAAVAAPAAGNGN